MITTVALSVTVVFAVLLAFFALIGALVGSKRGAFKQLLATVLILVSAFSAFVATKAIAAPVGEAVWPYVETYVPAEYVSALESSPSLTAFAKSLPAALVSPFLFVLVFLAAMLVLKIVYAIFKNIGGKNRKKSGFSRMIGTVSGTLAGLLVLVCLLVPMIGYINFAGDTLSALPASEDDSSAVLLRPAVSGVLSAAAPELDTGAETGGNDVFELAAQINDQYVKPITENALFNAISKFGCDALFKALTSSTINNTDVCVMDEISGLVRAVTRLEPLFGTPMGEFDGKQAEAIRSMISDIDESHVLKNIFSEFLSAASVAWQNNETFFGISSPLSEETSPLLRPLMEELLDVLSTATPDNISADLYTVADVFGVLATNKTFAIFGEGVKPEDVIAGLSSETVLSDMLVAIKANPHMEGLIPAVINMGMYAIGEAVGLPADDTAVYEDLMDNVTEVINAALAIENEEERVAYIAERIEATMASFGMTISKENAQFYAESIANDFETGNIYTKEQIVDYFAEIAAYFAGLEEENENLSAGSAKGDSMLLLGSGAGAGSGKVSFTRPQNKPQITDNGMSAMLSGEKTLEHGLITVESLKMSKEDIENMSVEDIKSDSKLLTESLAVIADVVQVLTGGSGESGEGNEGGGSGDGDKPADTQPGLDMVGKLNEAGLGKALGNLATTGMLKDAAPKLLVGALQSSGVVLEKTETEKIINTIKEDAEKRNEQIAAGGNADDLAPSVVESLVNSASDLLAVMNHIQSATLTEAELIADLEKVFKGLTPDSADMVCGFVQPSLIRKYASTLSEQRAADVCTLLKNALIEIANSEEEEYAAESALMSDLLQIVFTAKNSTATRLFADPLTGEPGKMGVTAEAFIAKVASSSLIASAISKSNLGIDPFEVSHMLHENDVADFILHANNAIATDATLQANYRNVISIAGVAGIELVYSAESNIFSLK